METQRSIPPRHAALRIATGCLLVALLLLPLCTSGESSLQKEENPTRLAPMTVPVLTPPAMTWTATAELSIVQPAPSATKDVGYIVLTVAVLFLAALGAVSLGYRLVSRLTRRGLAAASDASKRHAAQDRLADGVPGLLSYEALAQEGQTLLRSTEARVCHALLLVELAELDTLQSELDGRQLEQLCLHAAQVLQRLVGSADLVGTVAQGQFALLLRDVPEPELISVKAADICDTLRVVGHQTAQRLACHVGISLFQGGDDKNFHQLMREAELALTHCADREYTYYETPDGAESADETLFRAHGQGDRNLYGENRHLQNFLRRMDGYLLVLQVGERISPLYVSAGYYSIEAAGADPRQLSLSDEVSTEDLPAVSVLLRVCAVHDVMQDLVYRTPSGHWHRAQFSKLKDGQRSSTTVLAAVTDVSKQNLQELQNRLRCQQMEALFHALQLSTFEVDLSSRTIAFFSEQSGADDRFVLPDFPESLVAMGAVMPISQEELRQFAKKIFRGDPAGKADLWVWTGEDGAREQIHLTFHSVPDDHGQPVKGVGMSELTAKLKQSVPDSSAEYDQNAALKMQLKMQERYYLYAQKYQTELRKYRHDRRNTFIALSAMLETNDTQGIRRYVDKLGEEIHAAATVISTQNPALDALLSDKFAQAKAGGIQVKHMIGLKPNTGVESIDFCVVMGCSLDNAIESCQRVMGNGESAFLSLNLIERRGVIVCKLQNSAVNEEGNADFHTTKWDAVNHGFGLKNVEAIVHKYGGLLSLRREDGLFITEFTLFTP